MAYADLTAEQQKYYQALAAAGAGNSAYTDSTTLERRRADDLSQYKTDTSKITDLFNRASNFSTSLDTRDQQSPLIQQYLTEANELLQRVNSNPIYQALGLNFTPPKALTSAEQAARDQAGIPTATAGSNATASGTGTGANAAPALQPNFIAGLSDAQKQSITNLAQNKPVDQWSATDLKNWNYATNNQATSAGPLNSQGLTMEQANNPANFDQTGKYVGPGGASGSARPAGLPSTGNAALDAAQNSLYGVLQSNLANGNKVNPNLQITPDLVGKFISDAHKVVDPYSQQVLTNEIANINASLKTLGTQYQNDQGNTIAGFQNDLATERNAAGNAGVAFSGGRGLAEQNMLNATNRTLSSLDAGYGNTIGNTLRTGASAVGSNNFGLNGGVGDFQLPSLLGSTATLQGARGGSTAGGALNYGYDPSLYKIGSLGSTYNSSLANQSNQFLSNYLGSASNNSGTSKSFQVDANGNLNLM